MAERDPDLASVQQVRDLVRAAVDAQQRWAGFSQPQIDAVIDAMAAAATAAAEPLARLAVEETGYGNVPDKIKKNKFCSEDVYRAIRPMQTVGILRDDRENSVLEIAEPVGIVAAIIPSTNPTSTAIYKILISLKARNAVLLSPHPSAKKCICATTDVLYKAALKAGAPEGIIGCLTQVTAASTQELMRHRRIGVILATGGTGLVREQGAYFLKPAEIEAVGKLVIRPDTFLVNPKVVGRPAPVIAEMAGFSVPPATRVLVAELTGVGRDTPLSAEKLSPILALYTVRNPREATELANRLL